MKTIIKTFLAWFKYTYAPLAVHIIPVDRRNDSQVIYAWTHTEALEWMACALRDDEVFVVRRPCKIQSFKLVAFRSAVQEVSQ
jgi:hypothetical protein